MLENFFEINFPYGMKRNASGEWMLFNRENNPMSLRPGMTNGWEEYPALYNKFYGITPQFLLHLVEGCEDLLQRDEAGKIQTVYFYKTYAAPFQDGKMNLRSWHTYIYILQQLGNLKYRVPVNTYPE